MKFTCTKENIVKALGLVSPLANKQGHLPVLMNVLIVVENSKVELIATNLEVAVKTTLRAKIESEGSYTVPAKTLTDYINLLNGEQVEFELQDNELKVNSGSSNTKIKGLPADEFPVVPEIEEKNSYTIEVEAFRQSLSKTVFAAAKNEIRPELSGVYLGFFTSRHSGLIMAATDSYRLSEAKLVVDQGEVNMEVIIPSRTAYEIIRLLSSAKDMGAEKNVRLWLSEGQIGLRYDSFEMTSRLVDGNYPDYSQIIPDKFSTKAVFPADVMVKNIKAASLFTTVGVNAVSLDVSAQDNSVSVSSTNNQRGEYKSDVEAEVSGEENSILLNFRYVLDGLQQMAGEASFELNGADSPCMFKEKDKNDFVYIVMPIRQ